MKKVLSPRVSPEVRQRLRISERGVDARAGACIEEQLQEITTKHGGRLLEILKTAAEVKKARQNLTGLRKKLNDASDSTTLGGASSDPIGVVHEVRAAVLIAEQCIKHSEDLISKLTEIPFTRLIFLHQKATEAVEQALGTGLLSRRPSDDLLALATFAVVRGAIREPNFKTEKSA